MTMMLNWSIFLCILFISEQAFAKIYPYETPVVKYLKPLIISKKPSGLSGVDCIYVINLDRRPEKWKRMSKLLRDFKLHVNRVSAIDGRTISEKAQRELSGPYPVRLRGGQFGCLLSHLSVLKNAYENGFHLIWILEDDIEFREDVYQLPPLLKKLSSIDPDWDVFYTDVDSKNTQGEYVPSVGSNFRPDQEYFPLEYYLKRTQVDYEVMKIGQRFGSYSIFISQKGIQKILNYFSHVYIWDPFDIDMHYIPNIREYSSTRDIVSVWYQSLCSDTYTHSN